MKARDEGFSEGGERGVAASGRLADGDKGLIAEGWTLGRQGEDIGTVKIPKWLSEYTGKNLVL